MLTTTTTTTKNCFQAIKYLSAAGFGAKLLGVFQNGMVQSFINARTLIPQGKP
jgi:ethanolamine kinase